jgi:hypothetical protein
LLVVQGTGDRFGMPPAKRRRTVVQVAGDHSLRTDPGAVAEAVRAWLLRQKPSVSGTVPRPLRADSRAASSAASSASRSRSGLTARQS